MTAGGDEEEDASMHDLNIMVDCRHEGAVSEGEGQHYNLIMVIEPKVRVCGLELK
jgi:hypothetical protein